MITTFKYWRYRLRHSLPHGNSGKFILIALLVVTLPVGLILIRQEQKSNAEASIDAVSLYFSPAEQHLPPPSNFKIIANMNTNQVGFVRVEFTIDVSKVQLSNEIAVTNRLATVIEKTPMSVVNSTGVGIFIAALSPLDRNNPLTGIIELASFNIHSISNQPNEQSSLSLTNSGIQIINMNSQAISFTTQSASLTLNPSANEPATPLSNSETPVTPTIPLPASTLIQSEVSPTAAAKIGDVNGDGVVNTTDLGLITDSYGVVPASGSRVDVNKDGLVNIIDVGIVIDNYSL